MNYQRSLLSSLAGTLALFVAIGCGQAFAQSSGGAYTIRKSAIAGGGGASANGSIQLTGTTGQSATRTVSDGTNTIAAGFWTSGTCTFTAAGSVITPGTPADAVVGQNYSQTFAGNGSVGPYTFAVTAGALPNGLSLNTSGVLSGTPSGTGTANFTVMVTDGQGCTAAQSFSLTVNCPAIALPALPSAIAGASYSATITAAPAGGNYSYSLTGTLPPGLNFNNGTLSGTPTVAGVNNFTVTATGFGSCAGSQAYSLMVNCPAVSLSPVAMADGQAGASYNQSLAAQPAGGNYSYALTNGALPNGLTLNSATGAITGTPSQTGTFNFRIAVTGFGACAGFRDYQILITCQTVTVTPASLPNGTMGTAYNQSISAMPAASYAYSVTSGALPTGLMLNGSTGAITGTPANAGSFNFTVTATAGACAGSASYSVTIGCLTIAFTTTSPLPAGQAGVAYSQPLGITPAGTYSFSVLSGSLPIGLTLNTSTGVISGLPTVTGTYNFTIKAQAANGCLATQACSLAINCPTIALAPASLPNGTTGTAYNQSVSVSPAGGGYSFSMTSGALPTGIALNPATGSLSGMPTANGTFNFIIRATGFGGCIGNQSYTVVISGGACPSISLPASLPSGAIGQLYSNSVAASPANSYSYTFTGSLPPGLTLFGAFGLVYGYPTTNGTYAFTLTATDSNNCSASQNYVVVIGGALLQLPVNDFSGDRQSDFVLWRAAQTQWMILDGASGVAQTVLWGRDGDVAAPGDYDGDGKADLAALGKDGHWRIKLSRDGSTLDKAWGLGTDVPVPGDYDGDGKTDLAIWRGTEAGWYIQRSSDGKIETMQWGSSLAPYFDVPVPGDYDGDGKTDVAVFRQSNGHWYIKRSSDGQTVDNLWGLGTDVPVPGDYDGDGKTDIAVWRGAIGAWYIVRSSDGAVGSKVWGASYSPYFDVPAVGDYDGDGKTDIAVWRSAEGRWYVLQSSNGATRTVSQGRTGDQPVTALPRQ